MDVPPAGPPPELGDQSSPGADTDENQGAEASPELAYYLSQQETELAQRERYRKHVQDPGYLPSLQGATESYREVEKFEPGDVVQWKRLMRIQPYPDYGAPATFLRYMTASESKLAAENVFNPSRVDDDCYIGYLDYDLDFETIRCASARLDHWARDGDEQNPSRQA